MNIDLQKVYANDQQYVDSIIQSLRKTAWEELKTTRLEGSSPEELQVMENLWNHGFIKGCEASTQISIQIWDSMQKNKKNETSN